ncbi:MAG: TonB C-terminal domain-containing protein [Candidatus Omnitrophica bacterium]|nr:TonB C-terminal domain-containing protein [Candidatus Omnitrophota bacterium]
MKLKKEICVVLLAGLFFVSLAAYSSDDFFASYLDAESVEPLVNNVFYETDVRQALQDVSAQTKVPIVIDPSVQGFINVELENVPLEEALSMILIPLGYNFKKIDKYYIVGLAKPESPVFDLLAKTEVIALDYVKAKDVESLVSDFFHPYIKANLQNNSVTITAPLNIIARFRQDINKIDQPRQQVMMEALVIEISESDKKELGVKWGSMQEGGFTVSPPSNFTLEKGLGSATTAEYTLSGTVTQSTLITLKTMIQTGKAVVRANPRISALDGEEANIFIGKEEFFLINTGSQAYPYNTLQSIGTGVTLKVTPSVSSSGAITVKIQPEVSEVVGTSSANLPIVNRRTVSTTVRVFDGDTIGIGGLIQHNSSQTKTRAPMLSHVPFLGNFFKSKDRTAEDKEVLIFITPHLSNLGEKFKEFDPDSIEEGQNRFFKRKSQPSQNYRSRRDSVINSQNIRVESSSNVYGDQRYLVDRYVAYARDVIDTSRFRNLILSLSSSSAINRNILFRITVGSDGYISDISMLRASGSQLIDRTIREEIVQASPLPNFPQGIRRRSLTFDIAITLS